MSNRKKVIAVLNFIKPYWQKELAVFILMVLGTLINLSYPLLLKILIDDVILKGNVRLLLIVSISIFGTSILGFFLSALSGYLYVRLTTRILFDMRVHIFEHLQRLSLRFYTKTKVGEIVSRINNDIAEVQSTATGALLNLITWLLTLIGTAVFLIWLNWKLFLFGCIPILFGSLIFQRYQHKVTELVKTVRQKDAEITSFITETFSAIRLIKSFNAEKFQLKKFVERCRDVIDSVLKYQISSTFLSGIPTIAISISSLIVFLYGGHMVITNMMTVGGLVAFLTYQAKFFGPLQNLMGLYMGVKKASVSLDRVFELLEIRPEIKTRDNAIILNGIKGKIEFKEVWFAYEPKETILRGVSFTIPEHSCIGIMGSSGVGKTTIINLLFRFYDTISGSIKIDGYDIRDLNMESLRSQMAVVSEDTFLFHTTIEENIRYGRRDATEEEIIRAARIAGIDDFIVSLQEGYNTVVGERGTRLSAGQRQRVSIARAILKSPKILVLDEATSSIDLVTEEEIRKTLEPLIQNSTTIIITHRIHSLRDTDAIIVLEEGKIVRNGRYEDILNGYGFYSRKEIPKELVYAG